jgi:hypothetical protein
LCITPTGSHIYIVLGFSGPQEGIKRYDWYSQDTPFVYSGAFTPLSDPQYIKVSPDGKILTVVSQTNIVSSKQYLRTFFIQSDGSLVDTGYSFPFSGTFGDFVGDLQFVYPPAPTYIPEELWYDPPPDTVHHSSQTLIDNTHKSP